MSVENQVGLVLHEIIYREAIGFGQRDSVNTRYFVSRLASSEKPFASEKEFIDFLILIGFRSTDVRGVHLRLIGDELDKELDPDLTAGQRPLSLSFFPNGRVKQGRIVEKSEVMLQGQRVRVGCLLNSVEFFPTGSIKIIDLADAHRFKVGQESPLFSYCRFVEFFESGEVRRGILGQGALLPSVDGSLQWFNADSHLVFDEAGRASSL